MSRYIDADLIKTVVYPPAPKEEETDSEYFYRMGWQVGIGKVLKLPTADVRENVKSEWQQMESIYDDCTWICSVCGEPFILIAGDPAENGYNFCPNCGADMRAEK